MLLDSGASACFLYKEFAKRHKIPLVEKANLIRIEVIDEPSLLSGTVTHQSEPMEGAFKKPNSYVVLTL